MSDERPQDYPGYSGAPTPAPEPTRYQLQPGYADQQPAYGVLRDNSNATVSLVLGLVGLCTCILLASPFAWWLGSKAIAEIDANPGVYNNRGMAMAGKITGIVGSVLLCLFVFACIAGAVISIVAASRSN
jgi:hypothetical protein